MARRKTSKRKASLEKRKASLEIEQTPGRPVLNRLTPVSILSQDEVESLHQASLKVLAEHGIQFSLSEARAILKTAGADVRDSDAMVRFDPDMLMGYLAKAPAAFTLHARNPAHDLRLGDGHVNFSSVSSAPHCTDTLKGRRAGNREDFENFLRLTQAVNVAHGSAGYPVEPIDIPVPVRHLRATHTILALTDKTFRLYNHSRQRTLDVLEMTRIAHNLSEEAFVEKPCVFASINPNSPRALGYDRMRPGWTSADDLAFYTGRRHGACFGCRRTCTTKRRGAGWNRLLPDGSSRNTSDLWRLCIKRRHEKRGPGFWHTRACQNHTRDRTDGEAVQLALSLGKRQCL